MSKLTTLFVAIAATLSMSAAGAAGVNSSAGPQASKSYSGTLSSSQRGAAINQFVRKWGPYVQKVYGLDVRTWSERMVSQFAKGDALNIQRALERNTFDGAMAELNGVGHKLSDEQAITKLAASSLTTGKGSVTPSLLGSTVNDLVYTPITPCRLADTRLAIGAIAAGTSRSLKAWGYSTYADQGGSATDCGLTGIGQPTALELNVTAVFPTAAGYATVYSGALASPPLTASVNYVAGAIVNNALVSTVGNVPDLKIFSYAQAHYVVDVVGIYDTPVATPLDCTTASQTFTVAPAPSQFTTASAVCTTGTVTGGGCYAGYDGTDGLNVVSNTRQSGNGWFCAIRPSGATVDSANAVAYAQCCRVPGR